MLKKVLTALLVTGLVLSFASCGKKDDNPSGGNVTPTTNPTQQTGDNNTTDISDSEDIDYDAILSKERYDGYEYRILVRKGSLDSQYFEEAQEDIVDDAIYRRNKIVEEKYGITITASESSHSNYDTSALNSILAGDDAYDVIFAHSRAAFAYAVQGAGYNIHDIRPFTWICRGGRKTSTITVP